MPRAKRNAKAKAVLDKPSTTGWLTSDEDEIRLRQWRGRTEILSITAAELDYPLFGTFRVQSAGGSHYDVEIRSLDDRLNSCGCIDHQVNGLGTCKHIEGTLAALRRRGKARQIDEKPRVEVFLDRRTAAPAILWPEGVSAAKLAPVREWLTPWLEDGDRLAVDPVGVDQLVTAFAEAPSKLRRSIRVSGHFRPWLDRARRERARVEARTKFEAEVERGEATLDVLKHRLLPYQRAGAMHLAFGERALLADDMGLGKTIQAIAACELLGRMKDVRRVLVVCPASLKAEWEEQIAQFSERDTRLVFGPRPQRLAAYKDPAFFTIVNYEQVLNDADDINGILAPDIVVLDEAQRIKNWHTKTARRVKSLRSTYAFVLTGTPVENRIDELYSIIQYLDPGVFGPLFRFNRDFYQLDERGRPVDYQNLSEMRRRVQPLMLRRRKAEVETELPGRTVKTYFVSMADEQKDRYDDYKAPAAKLLALAQKRPLLPAEFDKLQMLLACMRMVCDTPAILDPSCRISPKLEELEGILEDLLEEPDRKVIVFSEWERMLTMVRELAGEMGVEAAWHTGSLPQPRRRAEINRFKHDPACRLFLSTDSGSVGLNLQVASAVVNVDLPWNPAKLEQRIARAWRKNQMRSVNVINLVAEGTIEHSILHLLGQKQALADGVLDGAGDLGSLKMPSGRGAMIERIQAMLSASGRLAPRVVAPDEAFALDLVQRHGDKVLLVEARRDSEGRTSLLAVVELDQDTLAAETRRFDAQAQFVVEFVDHAAWLALRRLAAAGLVRFTHEPRVLHRSDRLPAEPGAAAPPDARAGEAMRQAERTARMARVLAAGGFPEEVPGLAVKALRLAAGALLAVRGESGENVATIDDIDIRALVERGAMPPEATLILDGVRSEAAATSDGLASMQSGIERILGTIGRNEPRLSA
jgi:superfamily II DNA or RNA helicase